MKGHTKIELFNAKTGELEKSYEKDNLVTNAVKYLIAWQTMAGRSMNESVFPIAKNALGGLLLFDSTLTEDADNIAFPSDMMDISFPEEAEALSATITPAPLAWLPLIVV